MKWLARLLQLWEARKLQKGLERDMRRTASRAADIGRVQQLLDFREQSKVAFLAFERKQEPVKAAYYKGQYDLCEKLLDQGAHDAGS